MLVDTLLATTERGPGRLALADPRMEFTYDRLTAVASVLRGVVLKETTCERVGICLPACALFPATLYGVLWAGRRAVPLNFLLSPEELEAVVRDSGIDLVFSVRYFEDLLSKLPVRRLMLEDLPIKLRVLLSMVRKRPPAPQPDPDDTAVILYTSGTSALPKGVELTHRNLQSNCDNCIASAHFHGDHRFLNFLPPFHVFGLTANVLVPVTAGSAVFCLPRFQPTMVLDWAKEKAISVLMGIPSMYGAMMRVKSPPAGVFEKLYLAVSGGEPLPEAIEAGCRERLGLELLQGYGLTETSPVVSLCAPHAKKSRTVGRPIANTRLRIVEDSGADVPAGEPNQDPGFQSCAARDAGRDAPIDQPGEIWVQGPGVMKGYYKKPEETRQVITPEGWFKTGDIGTVDAEGFLSITGRKKEMLIVGGENVFPGEIEGVLAQHPAVKQAAVIGIQDPSRGEVALAFVTLQDGAAVEDIALRQFARERLAGYKVPREVRIVPDLPTGPTGKVLKRKLRDLL